LKRQRNIIDFYTLFPWSEEKERILLCFVSTPLSVFLLASVMFFIYAIKKEASILLKNAPEMVIQRMIAGRHELIPLGYMDKLKNIRGVSSVKSRLWAVLL